jgi:hypothetical protein
MRTRILALVVALGAVACSKSGGGATGGRDAIIASWKKAGLTVSAMTPDKSGAIGTDCVTGTVNGVDVVLCTFAKPEDATAAKDKAYAWIGNNAPTGSAMVSARTLLAVADRKSADPSGRTINTITKTFAGK